MLIPDVACKTVFTFAVKTDLIALILGEIKCIAGCFTHNSNAAQPMSVNTSDQKTCLRTDKET